jgi:predicted nuclease of predicted toxin-antitoxin system
LRLLLDQNLSPRLLDVLTDLYPGSTHVRNVGLQAADDDAVWVHAAREGFAIVSKDADFRQRSFLFGHPPKVIWIRRGNCTTDEIAALLHAHHFDILKVRGGRRRGVPRARLNTGSRCSGSRRPSTSSGRAPRGSYEQRSRALPATATVAGLRG